MTTNPSKSPSDTAIDKAIHPVTEFLKLEIASCVSASPPAPPPPGANPLT